MKFTPANSEDTPKTCKAMMLKDTPPLNENTIEDNGGYTVHPVATPPTPNLSFVAPVATPK